MDWYGLLCCKWSISDNVLRSGKLMIWRSLLLLGTSVKLRVPMNMRSSGAVAFWNLWGLFSSCSIYHSVIVSML